MGYLEGHYRYKSPFPPVVRIEYRISFHIFYTYSYFCLEHEIIELPKNFYLEVSCSPYSLRQFVLNRRARRPGVSRTRTDRILPSCPG